MAGAVRALRRLVEAEMLRNGSPTFGRALPPRASAWYNKKVRGSFYGKKQNGKSPFAVAAVFKLLLYQRLVLLI